MIIITAAVPPINRLLSSLDSRHISVSSHQFFNKPTVQCVKISGASWAFCEWWNAAMKKRQTILYAVFLFYRNIIA